MYILVDNENKIERLATLARQIWSNHFGQMIAADILDLVIKNVQSKEAIASQIKDGFLYYLIPGQHEPVGYFAYRVSASESNLFLSKLYLLASERKKGIGRQVVRHLEQLCNQEKISTISLTVYEKNDSAIKAYQSMGFKKTGIITRDLGDGISADDIRMEKSV